MTAATIFPDTTILIQYEALDHIDWRSVLGVKHVKLVLTSAVLVEIEEIKNQDISPSLAEKARSALSSIDTLLNNDEAAPDFFSIEKADAPKLDFDLEQLDPNSVADLLVATVITYQRTHALEYVVLFSDDTETRTKAAAAGIEISKLSKSFLLDKTAENKLQEEAPSEVTPLSKATSSPLINLSTKKLVSPTPLFKNKIINRESEPVQAEFAPKKSTDEEQPVKINKLFEVIEPKEEPVKSPVVAVEQPQDEVEDAQLNGAEIAGDTSEETSDESGTAPEADERPPETEQLSPSPFVDIKQAPARPDLSQVESYHPTLPASLLNGESLANQTTTNGKEDESDVRQEIPVTNEAAEANGQLPPITSRITLPDQKHNTTKDRNQIPPRPTQSFSFTSQSVASEAGSDVKPHEPIPEPPVEKADLRLAFEGDETRSGLIIYHPEYPSIDEVTESLSQLKRSYPKLAMMGASGGDGVGNGINSFHEPMPSSGSDLIFQRRDARIKRYNVALDAYYANSEKYLSEVAEFENLRRRSARLDLTLINELPDALKSLYIAIHFPSNLRVFSEDNLPEKPVGPYPPEEPNLDAVFDRLRLPTVPVPGELSPDNQDIKMRSRNLAPMEVRWNKGWDVIYSKKEIQKNEKIPFNPLYIVFNSFEHATSFRIQFRITVASASYEERGDLEVLVRKEI